MTPIEFFIPGDPAPAGSKTASVLMRGGKIVFSKGRPVIIYRDDSKGRPKWIKAVSVAARKHYRGEPFTGPFEAHFEFRFLRPVSHFTSKGALVKGQTAYHEQKPDLTKLVRCTEDALTGIVWKDDCRRVSGSERKVWISNGEPGCLVRIIPLDQETDLWQSENRPTTSTTRTLSPCSST